MEISGLSPNHPALSNLKRKGVNQGSGSAAGTVQGSGDRGIHSSSPGCSTQYVKRSRPISTPVIDSLASGPLSSFPKGLQSSTFKYRISNHKTFHIQGGVHNFLRLKKQNQTLLHLPSTIKCPLKSAALPLLLTKGGQLRSY